MSRGAPLAARASECPAVARRRRQAQRSVRRVPGQRLQGHRFRPAARLPRVRSARGRSARRREGECGQQGRRRQSARPQEPPRAPIAKGKAEEPSQPTAGRSQKERASPPREEDDDARLAWVNGRAPACRGGSGATGSPILGASAHVGEPAGQDRASRSVGSTAAEQEAGAGRGRHFSAARA